MAELAALGKEAGVPVLADQGCGRLFKDSAGPASELSVEELLEEGADLVCFSGDKMLGGPQAGVLVGRRELVARCAKHPLARALRPDKLTLAALAATALGAIAADPAAELPAARMLSLSEGELRAAAEELAAALRAAAPGLAVETIAGVSRVGGGAAPEEDLPTSLVSVRPPAGLSDDALLDAAARARAAGRGPRRRGCGAVRPAYAAARGGGDRRGGGGGGGGGGAVRRGAAPPGRWMRPCSPS